eukprot:COSAG02_NODE_23333_length_722_cov_0.892456_1_plen_113_part_10
MAADLAHPEWFEFAVEVSSAADVRKVRSAIDKYRQGKNLWMWLSVTATVAVEGQACLCVGQTVSDQTDIADTTNFLVQHIHIAIIYGPLPPCLTRCALAAARARSPGAASHAE